MDIVPLPHDADPALIDGSVALTNAVHAADSPWVHPETASNLRGALEHGWDGEPPITFVGLDGDHVVAQGMVHVSDWDNLDLAWLGAEVHPEHRRQGLGSAMFAFVRDHAAGMGRTKTGADAWDGNPGMAFLERHGMAPKSRAINRRQHVAELDFDDVRSRYHGAAAAAAAYEVVRIEGTTPESLLPAMSEMVASINDAPLDDLEIEDEVFPPERVSAYENAQIARGFRMYRLLAQHRESGDLAGHTVVAVDGSRPHIGHQHDTTVVRSHRGHRLGLLLKAGMNLWLADTEPQLLTVDTWNAESNDHMIGVNEALGYRWMGREVEFQP